MRPREAWERVGRGRRLSRSTLRVSLHTTDNLLFQLYILFAVIIFRDRAAHAGSHYGLSVTFGYCCTSNTGGRKIGVSLVTDVVLLL